MIPDSFLEELKQRCDIEMCIRDSIKGVRVLLKKYAIPLFASRETLEWLADRGELPSTGPVQEISASTVIAAGAMEIRPFATSHDSLSSFGYAVNLPDGRRISVATDLGYEMCIRDSSMSPVWWWQSWWDCSSRGPSSRAIPFPLSWNCLRTVFPRPRMCCATCGKKPRTLW